MDDLSLKIDFEVGDGAQLFAGFGEQFKQMGASAGAAFAQSFNAQIKNASAGGVFTELTKNAQEAGKTSGGKLSTSFGAATKNVFSALAPAASKASSLVGGAFTLMSKGIGGVMSGIKNSISATFSKITGSIKAFATNIVQGVGYAIGSGVQQKISGFFNDIAANTSNLAQSLGGSEKVFGEYAQYMQDVAQKASTVMGLSQNDYLEYANKIGMLMQGTGMETGQAVDLTTLAMQRAADVASVMGISVQDAMTAIAGAAKGNFTMMDNLGVAINETALKEYAASIGVSTKAMSTQTKVGLAYQLFLEKTSDMAGNYAAENETVAGSAQTAAAAYATMVQSLGNSLAPALVTLNKLKGAFFAAFPVEEFGLRLSTISTKLSDFLNGRGFSFGEFWKDAFAAFDSFSSFFKDIGDRIKEPLQTIGKNFQALTDEFIVFEAPALKEFFGNAVVKGIEKFAEITTIFRDITKNAEPFAEKILPSVEKAFESIGNFVTKFLKADNGEAMGKLFDTMASAAQLFLDTVSAVFDFLAKDSTIKVITTIIDKVNGAILAFDSLIKLFQGDFSGAVDTANAANASWYSKSAQTETAASPVTTTKPTTFTTSAATPTTNSQTSNSTQEKSKSGFSIGSWLKDTFKIPAFASGTQSAPGGLSLVGEKGAELVNLKKGSQVYSASDTRQILSGSGGNTYNITINVPSTVSAQLASEIARTVKAEIDKNNKQNLRRVV